MHSWPHSSREKRSGRIAKRGRAHVGYRRRRERDRGTRGGLVPRPRPSRHRLRRGSPAGRPRPHRRRRRSRPGGRCRYRLHRLQRAELSQPGAALRTPRGSDRKERHVVLRLERWRGVRVPGPRPRVARSALQPRSSRLPAHGRRHPPIHSEVPAQPRSSTGKRPESSSIAGRTPNRSGETSFFR